MQFFFVFVTGTRDGSHGRLFGPLRLPRWIELHLKSTLSQSFVFSSSGRSTNIMSSVQKAARRKKRTCKHVLKSKEREKQQDECLISAEKSSPRKNKSKKKKKNIKDPSEAASYLSAWKHRDAGGAWKFNKNTQSWLLRHMFQAEKVAKGTFTLLLEYLGGLQGLTRTRTIADARKRVLRYKEYETSRESHGQKDGGNDDVIGKEDRKAYDGITDEDDEMRWRRLSEHEKRKEYKRARKVLEILKV